MLQLASLAANAAGIGTSVAGSAVDGVIKSASKAKAWKTATEFESMFLENSLDRLTQSDGTEGPLGENGTGGGVYRSMLTKEYATQIVKSGGVGIADSIFREIMKMQGAASEGATNAKG
ncbi:motility and Chemotaxis [Methylobacterium phyllosphaerae]|jgi:Rod binding domain-containing protein|uniref:Motility and Chemotaxis n=2 Tax=Methylobacterium TaxID=407 RepID=A0AAE8HSA1_9HYPH|nr:MULTISPECIES: rod-binding protein [Methylobacterium]AIQ93886.1 protein of unassigned function [Methylobacterium oryzae CBMB20]APT34139.1 motility and Chemotaxis [Methylobacterium phyllosphaerae]AWV14572.1 flagellar biosynthesis protein FlgJ [Methylobacterium sp. XJLW]WFS07549.1 rod-binding protein [Methylobacterium sp. 391_Methyba4]SFG97772.1 Rod binding protein [Methylobacterium phyllosphaerae]